MQRPGDGSSGIADLELGGARWIGIWLGGVSRNMIRSLRFLPANSAGPAMAAAVLLGSGGWVHGHQDPMGDIHPQVLVMDGKFAIVFNTSQPKQESNYTDEAPVQRMIFTATGHCSLRGTRWSGNARGARLTRWGCTDGRCAWANRQ